MKRIAILYICTGKYPIFSNDFYESVENFFLNGCHIEYFIFTDQQIEFINDRQTIVECKQLGWPLDTLIRFRMFYEIGSELEKFDYLFFMNANLLILKRISFEIFPFVKDFRNSSKGWIHITYNRKVCFHRQFFIITTHRHFQYHFALGQNFKYLTNMPG